MSSIFGLTRIMETSSLTLWVYHMRSIRRGLSLKSDKPKGSMNMSPLSLLSQRYCPDIFLEIDTKPTPPSQNGNKRCSDGNQTRSPQLLGSRASLIGSHARRTVTSFHPLPNLGLCILQQRAVL